LQSLTLTDNFQIVVNSVTPMLVASHAGVLSGISSLSIQQAQ